MSQTKAFDEIQRVVLRCRMPSAQELTQLDDNSKVCLVSTIVAGHLLSREDCLGSILQ